VFSCFEPWELLTGFPTAVARYVPPAVMVLVKVPPCEVVADVPGWSGEGCRGGGGESCWWLFSFMNVWPFMLRSVPPAVSALRAAGSPC